MGGRGAMLPTSAGSGHIAGHTVFLGEGVKRVSSASKSVLFLSKGRVKMLKAPSIYDVYI